MVSKQLHYMQCVLLVRMFGSGQTFSHHLDYIRLHCDGVGEIYLLGGSKIKVDIRKKKRVYYWAGYAADKSDILNRINELPTASGLKLLARLGV